MLVPEGETNIDFSNMISMNESAAFLWMCIGEESFEEKDLVLHLLDEYDVDEATATADVHTLVEQWREAEVIE